MKNILVIYFTQTGQAKLALDAVLKPFEGRLEYKIHYELLKPKQPLPYPWKFTEFCDVFPENVHGIPFELEPLSVDTSINYDLVFIAYQPWFLSICRPVNSFLLSAEAKKLLGGKPVITIINCRNMWLGAQEKMKQRLLDLNSKLVGN
ncbi:MAG: dialkylresorcinol condensing enzyme, partial [Bacteroidia bacterium]